MSDWRSARPTSPAISAGGWLRVVLRGAALGVTTYGGLLLLLLLRLIERPLFGQNRPWTPWITRAVCRLALFELGIGLQIKGQAMSGPGAMVANHSGWMDIFALNAATRLYFVSKAEVAGWPGIGWLARATGTVFITRKGTEARAQQLLFEERLTHGHKLLFFPEGTSSDALRVLPFKSTLFAAFFSPALRDALSVQPVSVVWHAPKGQDPRFYGWWGDMDFAPHLLKVLAARRQGRVEVVFHPPLRVADFPDRKALTAAAEAMVRGAHPQGLTAAA